MDDENDPQQGEGEVASAPEEADARKSPDGDFAEFPVTLEEFCRRHSLVERSVELLGAFYATESALVAAGRAAGTALESKFRKRLAAFAGRPVG